MKKLFLKILLLPVSVATYAYAISGISFNVTGHLGQVNTLAPIRISHIPVIIKDDNGKYLAAATTDNDGNFNVNIPDKGEKGYSFYYIPHNSDTEFITGYARFEKANTEITLFIP